MPASLTNKKKYMQPISKKITATAAFLSFLCVTLFSFTPAPGGDRFEIYLNNKLVLEQFVSQKADATYLTLHQSNYNDQIGVYYSHCGQTGHARSITIRDEDNRVIKTWKFADAAGDKGTMSWKVKDIMDLQKHKSHARLKLFYSSRELSAGKLLATVVKGDNSYAWVQ